MTMTADLEASCPLEVYTRTLEELNTIEMIDKMDMKGKNNRRVRSFVVHILATCSSPWVCFSARID